MGTKLNPGRFDCYAAAYHDEPMFVLLARDAIAPQLIRQWAYQRQRMVRDCLVSIEDQEKVAEAIACAEAMEEWRTRRERSKAVVSGQVKP